MMLSTETMVCLNIMITGKVLNIMKKIEAKISSKYEHLTPQIRKSSRWESVNHVNLKNGKNVKSMFRMAGTTQKPATNADRDVSTRETEG